MHLRSRPFVPLWYDVALLVSCAFTGVLLGYVSIAEVQRLLRARLGNPSAWALTAVYGVTLFVGYVVFHLLFVAEQDAA